MVYKTAAFDPNRVDFIFRLKPAIAVHDGEVGELAFFNRADLFFSAHQSRRFGGERGEGFVLFEAALDDARDVFAKHLAIAQAVGGEGDGVVALE